MNARPRPEPGPPDAAAGCEPGASRDGADRPLLGGRGRARTVGAVVVAAALAVGVWALIGQFASFGRLDRALHHADAGWLVLAGSTAVAGYGGYALLFRAFSQVAGGPRPPAALTVRLTVAILGASVVANSAGRLGTEYWSLRRMHQQAPAAWARTLAINTASWATLGALAVAGAAVSWAANSPVPGWLRWTWLAAVTSCTVAAMALTSPRHPSWAEDGGGRARRVVAAALRAVVLVRRAARRPLLLAAAGGGALLYWGSELVTVWAALRAFGTGIGFGPLVVGYATGYIATMLPLPAGGAGGVDAAATYALTLVGVPLAPALLAVLVQRVVTYWVPLLVALAGARAIRRLPGQLAAVPAPTTELAHVAEGTVA